MQNLIDITDLVTLETARHLQKTPYYGTTEGFEVLAKNKENIKSDSCIVCTGESKYDALLRLTEILSTGVEHFYVKTPCHIDLIGTACVVDELSEDVVNDQLSDFAKKDTRDLNTFTQLLPKGSGIFAAYALVAAKMKPGFEQFYKAYDVKITPENAHLYK